MADCLAPIFLRDRDIEVPCGKCGFCLKSKRSEWSFRLEQELKLHSDASFVTLTYADNNLTFLKGTAQLVVSDLQKFFKRVRKAGHKFRYYAVGEYGSTTFRPHYHIIFFGKVPELVINKAWRLGLVHVGNVTTASINYCLKYVVNSKGSYMKWNRVSPFAVMSRKPGLGANYLSPAMVEWHRNGRKNYVLDFDSKRRLPRFYKEKIFSRRDKFFIAKRAEREWFDSMRAELKRLSQFHPDPFAYYEEMRAASSKRVLDKARQNLTI